MQETTLACMKVNQEALFSCMHCFCAMWVSALHSNVHELDRSRKVWAEEQRQKYNLEWSCSVFTYIWPKVTINTAIFIGTKVCRYHANRMVKLNIHLICYKFSSHVYCYFFYCELQI